MFLALLLATTLTTATYTTSTPLDKTTLSPLPRVETNLMQSPTYCDKVSAHLIDRAHLDLPAIKCFKTFLATLPEDLITDDENEINDDFLKGELYLTFNPEIDVAAHTSELINALKNLSDDLEDSELPLKRITLAHASLFDPNDLSSFAEYDLITLFPQGRKWANFENMAEMQRVREKKPHCSRPTLPEKKEKRPQTEFHPTQFCEELLNTFNISLSNIAFWQCVPLD